MKDFNSYRMVLRPRSEITIGLVLYGENEPPEMQLENLWKITDLSTGEELTEPKIDFSDFSKGDIMYPSMMKPEVKRRWDQKQYEQEEAKASFAKLKRMIHARFMEQNPDLPLVQNLKQTTYGNEIQNEFKKLVSIRRSMLNPGSPQTGTGKSIHDELERDNVDINEIANEVLQFLTPEPENIYALMAVNRDKNLRIEDKLLVSSESTHVLEYGYDEGGRLQAVKYCGEPVEIYHYNQLGQRIFSQVAGGEKLEYQYNELRQLDRAGDTAYVYDHDGNLSEKESPEGVTKYEYLETGQLCAVRLPNGTHIEYHFDERGFRAAKHINGKLVQRYLWKDLTTLAAIKDAEGISRFHYNEHGRCMGMERNGQAALFATDQLGSIFSIADSSGKSVQEVLYDSFGRQILNSAPEEELLLGFAGGLYDSDTGLIHFGYREYDPTIGRFISPDPLGYAGGDVDVYGYCLDDPVNFVDPLGLRSHNGMHGAFGGGNIGGRAKSSLGSNRSKKQGL
ncbi:RHS repeat-associated core domain-containing protein [Maridesulfovibrio sp.]|uniref:RHS repeat domain-containing protein n=1 Tax=Maridesulfovibrio sp. TaxID=2795000 RepID=UPI002A18A9C7|nr:RHS repeat-associated core domain-containing protein [Maridesulfovibrio sp.]